MTNIGEETGPAWVEPAPHEEPIIVPPVPATPAPKPDRVVPEPKRELEPAR